MIDIAEDESDIGYELHELIFAESIGVNLEEDFASELLEIAVKALYTLPDGWEMEIAESDLGKIPFFFCSNSGESQWTHPFMDDFASVVQETRKELYENSEGGNIQETEYDDFRKIDEGDDEDEIILSEEDMKKDIEQHQVILLDEPVQTVTNLQLVDDNNDYVEVKSPSKRLSPRINEILVMNQLDHDLQFESLIQSTVFPSSDDIRASGAPPIESPLSIKVAQIGNPRKLRVSRRASVSSRPDDPTPEQQPLDSRMSFTQSNAVDDVVAITIASLNMKDDNGNDDPSKISYCKPAKPDSAVAELEPLDMFLFTNASSAAGKVDKKFEEEDSTDIVQSHDESIVESQSNGITKMDYYINSDAVDETATIVIASDSIMLWNRPVELHDDIPKLDFQPIPMEDSSNHILFTMALGVDLNRAEEGSSNVVDSSVEMVGGNPLGSTIITTTSFLSHEQVDYPEALSNAEHKVDDVFTISTVTGPDNVVAAESHVLETFDPFPVVCKSKAVFVDTFPDFFKVESKVLEMLTANEGEEDGSFVENLQHDIEKILAVRESQPVLDLQHPAVLGIQDTTNIDQARCTDGNNSDHSSLMPEDVDSFSSTVDGGKNPNVKKSMIGHEEVQNDAYRCVDILDDERFQTSKGVEPLDKNIDVAQHFAQLFQNQSTEGPTTHSNASSARPSARGISSGGEDVEKVHERETPPLSRGTDAKDGTNKWISKRTNSSNPVTKGSSTVKVSIPRKLSGKKRTTSAGRKWVTLGGYATYREAHLAVKMFETVYPAQSFVDKSYPIFSAKDAEYGIGDTEVDESMKVGNTTTLLLMMQGTVDKKTVHMTIGGEIPKLRISRDLTRMQWLVECSDPHAKRVFQGKVAHKRTLSPLRPVPYLPLVTLTDQNVMHDLTILTSDTQNHGLHSSVQGGGIAAQTSIFTAPFSPRSMLTNPNSNHLTTQLPMVYATASLYSTQSTMSITGNNNSTDRQSAAKKRVFSAGRLSMLPSGINVHANSNPPWDGGNHVSPNGQEFSQEILNRFPSLMDKPFRPKTFRHVLSNAGNGNRPHSSR